MKHSDNSLAMMMLCSDMAIDKTVEDFDKPFTVVQWSKLAENLVFNKLEPKHLFDLSDKKISDQLQLGYEESERIKRLLSRSGKFGLALTQVGDKGIEVLTRADELYPSQYKKKLKRLAPPVIFYSGNLRLLNNSGVAIVGSRNIDEESSNRAKEISKKCTFEGMNIVSGGAKGVDTIAEQVSIENDGTSIIVVADSLEKKIKLKDTRQSILNNNSLVFSTFGPNSSFKTYAAMERNKYIYALSDYAVVVASDYKKGGTWAGATENLRHAWTPLYVVNGDGISEGNIQLIGEKGAFPLPIDTIFGNEQLQTFFSQNYVVPVNKEKMVVEEKSVTIEQLELF